MPGRRPRDGIFVFIRWSRSSPGLGIASDLIVRSAGSRETPALEAYRAFTEGWLRLETLDIREIPQAIANFERAIRVDPRYALAYTGLASAQLAAYEDRRSENAPPQELLGAAVGHASGGDGSPPRCRRSCGLAFPWSAHGNERSVQSAAGRGAEPTNWRHFFRLGHA